MARFERQQGVRYECARSRQGLSVPAAGLQLDSGVNETSAHKPLRNAFTVGRASTVPREPMVYWSRLAIPLTFWSSSGDRASCALLTTGRRKVEPRRLLSSRNPWTHSRANAQLASLHKSQPPAGQRSGGRYGIAN